MKFLNYIKRLSLLAFTLLCVLAAGVLLPSCDGDEEGNAGEIRLQSFGPSPLMRGGELKFIGTNLDKVTAVILPENIEVTTFVTKTSNLLVIQVPEPTVEGIVTLVTPQGNIVTKTRLGIAEPITIASISPASVRPGGTITIEGTYLNLVKTVIFVDNKEVTEFTSQTKSSLELVVPEDAQTGTITLSDLLPDDDEVPNLIESEEELVVILPAVTTLTPSTIRAGDILTLTGTNLDLVKDVTFQVGQRVADTVFVSQTATAIEVEVPANAADGQIVIRPASGVEVLTPALTMVVPTITGFDNPGKNNDMISITGTNLDLVTSVMFVSSDEEAEETAGEIQTGGSATSITVKIPADAVEGVVTLNTGSGKSVSTSTPLELAVPTITNFTPTSVNTVDNPTITITGTDLDIVSKVVFGGGWEAEIADAVSATDTEIEVYVTPGSLSGEITLVTTNGTEVVSNDELTIVPHVPDVTVVPEEGVIGEYITIEGTNMDVPATIFFPDSAVATVFGAKTSTEITVLIPTTAQEGVGRIKFVTYKNEVYESPEISFKFPGVEPIQDPALIINDFSVTGTDNHGLGWDNWGGALQLVTSNPGPGISGNGNFAQGAITTSGWTWLWGCDHNDPVTQLGKPSNIAKADYLFKFDVFLTIAPPAGGNFYFRFGGDGTSEINLGNLGAATTEGHWVTMTFDLSTFGSLPATLPTGSQWGFIFNGNGNSYNLTGMRVDNFRFQEK